MGQERTQGDVEDERKIYVVGEVPCKSHRAAGGCVGADAQQAGFVSGGSARHGPQPQVPARSQGRVSACKTPRGDTQERS